MSTSAPVNQDIQVGHSARRRSFFSWQTLLVLCLGLILFLLGVQLRLHNLGLPFDRDGYDEGVYWQSLRAMAAGHTLYGQIFYSQPPFFLLSAFPTYLLAGQTLWAARLGVVVMSLFGLLGASLLGHALAGRVGAVVALALLVVDPLYLTQSQTLQAEAPAAALSLLAVGLAFLWWRYPLGPSGIAYAAGAGIALALSILCKLFAVAALVPIGLLFLAGLWRLSRLPRSERFAAARPLLAGSLAFLIICAAFVLPFLTVRHEFIQGVITFHTDAGKFFKNSFEQNFPMVQHLLTSITAIAALVGAIFGLARRDWRVLPLLGWFAATLYLLLEQAPLFHHHIVMLIPPLLALEIMGIGPLVFNKKLPSLLITIGTALALALLLFTMSQNLQGERNYYVSAAQEAVHTTQRDGIVVADLQHYTRPGQVVVTDAQFLAGLANRSTPPFLVDTSIVRIVSGYLTQQQLIDEASRPDVHAVLFYTTRLNRSSIGGFHTWVTHHFHLVKGYTLGRELWIR